MKTLYIENQVANHPRTQAILARFPGATIIPIERYGEVFNLKAQNFRVQKQNPAIILAKKTGKTVLKTPEGFGIGGNQNYYFSHMLNCLYDCRYCFLQGLYNSAHHVCFVNYEDFMQEIKQTAEAAEHPAYFFSGYDCDSLAMEPVTKFLENFLPFFEQTPNAILELRTKSANVQALLKHQAFENCVCAFSFTPDKISREHEHNVPPVAKRIAAMQKLHQAGWKLGLRLDPLIDAPDFEKQYKELLADIFAAVPAIAFHSVSIGPMRFPNKLFNKLIKLYPMDQLLNHPLVSAQGITSYPTEREAAMRATVLRLLAHHTQDTPIFSCMA